MAPIYFAGVQECERRPQKQSAVCNGIDGGDDV